mmetsp:Transcript_6355/g.12569  ORF Transcript_6355/g.12569 Transcript_6355/m.12569 type:complete len:338 (-) Transcript_6355:2006-3019(-)
MLPTSLRQSLCSLRASSSSCVMASLAVSAAPSFPSANSQRLVMSATFSLPSSSCLLRLRTSLESSSKPSLFKLRELFVLSSSAVRRSIFLLTVSLSAANLFFSCVAVLTLLFSSSSSLTKDSISAVKRLLSLTELSFATTRLSFTAARSAVKADISAFVLSLLMAKSVLAESRASRASWALFLCLSLRSRSSSTDLVSSAMRFLSISISADLEVFRVVTCCLRSLFSLFMSSVALLASLLKSSLVDFSSLSSSLAESYFCTRPSLETLRLSKLMLTPMSSFFTWLSSSMSSEDLPCAVSMSPWRRFVKPSVSDLVSSLSFCRCLMAPSALSYSLLRC